MSNREAAAASERPLPPLPMDLMRSVLDALECGLLWAERSESEGRMRRTTDEFRAWLIKHAASAPQAVRMPLTEEARLMAFYLEQDAHPNTDIVSFLRGIEAAEAAHGIVPLAPQDTAVEPTEAEQAEAIAEWNRRRARLSAPGAAQPAASGVDARAARHPTLEECHEAGVGPRNVPGIPYRSGGLPDTPEERERFEAYMRGHCWSIGEGYDEAQRIYPPGVRQLYGVWRDRGSLPSTALTGAAMKDEK